jgi:hypothetical protein
MQNLAPGGLSVAQTEQVIPIAASITDRGDSDLAGRLAPRAAECLPGLVGAAVRADDGRRDGGAEDIAAAADVGGQVPRASRLADALALGVRETFREGSLTGPAGGDVLATAVAVALARWFQKSLTHRSTYS